MFFISEEEIGELLDVTEDICNSEGWVTPEQIALAKKRIDIVNRIKSRPHTPAPDLKIMTIMGVPIIPAEFIEEGNRLSEELDKALKAHDAVTARTATLATLDALGDDLEFLPSSEDSHGVVWVTLRHVQDAINDRKAESLRTAAQEDRQ
jgi:hypothetical protein